MGSEMCIRDSTRAPTEPCAQALLLLDNLIRNGSERVIDNARDHVYELRSLESFRYTDENKKDQGINGMSHTGL